MRSTTRSNRPRRFLALLALPLALAVSAPGLASPTTDGTVAPDRSSTGEQNGVGLMRIVVADKSGIDRLNQLGVDLAEYVKPVDNGIEVHAILSPEESQALFDKGFDVQDAISDQGDYAQNMAERSAAIRAATAATATTDTLTVLRAEWFSSLDNQLFLNIEVKSGAGTDSTTVLTASWDSGSGTEIGSGGTATMSRFTDAGQYMYHRFSNPVPHHRRRPRPPSPATRAARPRSTSRNGWAPRDRTPASTRTCRTSSTTTWTRPRSPHGSPAWPRSSPSSPS
ncbi:hypothetical protein ABZV78_02625 [Micromonospora sp. NPDC004540]|uniref:hypothetical protein n=1 Tax=Micromonospora sp. NPDC004540 TaxID=3154457 RepID=UPI0033BC05ED